MKRVTAREKFRTKVQEFKEWQKKNRRFPTLHRANEKCRLMAARRHRPPARSILNYRKRTISVVDITFINKVMSTTNLPEIIPPIKGGGCFSAMHCASVRLPMQQQSTPPPYLAAPPVTLLSPVVAQSVSTTLTLLCQMKSAGSWRSVRWI